MGQPADSVEGWAAEEEAKTEEVKETVETTEKTEESVAEPTEEV